MQRLQKWLAGKLRKKLSQSNIAPKLVEKPHTTSSSLRDTPHTHQFRREGTPSQSPAAPSAAGEQQSAAMPGRCPSP